MSQRVGGLPEVSGSLGRPRSDGDPRDSRVAVVMITRNRADEALRTLRRLRSLPERPRIVVVDNASEDGTAVRLRAAFPNIRVIACPVNLGAAGRTLGVLSLDAPYVAFCDDDAWWAPGSLRRAADLLDANPRLAVLNARILVGDAEEEDPISAEMAASPLPPVPSIPAARLLSFLAGASVLRRSAYVDAGGFEPRLLIGGEEELLAVDLASAGWDMAYVPDLVVHHHPSRARDPHARRRIGIRNTLWFTWLRRPLPSAIRRTASLLTSVPRDRVSAAAVADALRGVAWVASNRRVVSAPIERQLRALEGSQRRSVARRYVS